MEAGVMFIVRLVQFILAPDKRTYMAFRPQRLIDYRVEKHILKRQDLRKVYVDINNAKITFQGTEYILLVINNIIEVAIHINRMHSKELEGRLLIDRKTSKLVYLRGKRVDPKVYAPITDIYNGDTFNINVSVRLW